MTAQIRKEIAIMKNIDHPNVIHIKDVFATKSKIFIVLELIHGGELFDYILKKKRLSESEARFFFLQLLDGIAYCHNNGVCHRDLKPENLLLDSNGSLKISDFGLSALYIGTNDKHDTNIASNNEASKSSGNHCYTSREALLHTTCGTPNYVAPEVLECEGYDGSKADVWSIGIIFFVLVTGRLPFEEETMPALFAKIKRAEFKIPVDISSEAQDLIRRILVTDPQQRITLRQLRKHHWCAKEVEPPALPLRHESHAKKTALTTAPVTTDASTGAGREKEISTTMESSKKKSISGGHGHDDNSANCEDKENHSSQKLVNTTGTDIHDGAPGDMTDASQTSSNTEAENEREDDEVMITIKEVTTSRRVLFDASKDYQHKSSQSIEEKCTLTNTVSTSSNSDLPKPPAAEKTEQLSKEMVKKKSNVDELSLELQSPTLSSVTGGTTSAATSNSDDVTKCESVQSSLEEENDISILPIPSSAFSNAREQIYAASAESLVSSTRASSDGRGGQRSFVEAESGNKQSFEIEETKEFAEDDVKISPVAQEKTECTCVIA